MNLGRLLHQSGATPAAIEHYAAALVLDKGDAASYDGMARIWRDRHHYRV